MTQQEELKQPIDISQTKLENYSIKFNYDYYIKLIALKILNDIDRQHKAD